MITRDKIAQLEKMRVKQWTDAGGLISQRYKKPHRPTFTHFKLSRWENTHTYCTHTKNQHGLQLYRDYNYSDPFHGYVGIWMQRTDFTQTYPIRIMRSCCEAAPALLQTAVDLNTPCPVDPSGNKAVYGENTMQTEKYPNFHQKMNTILITVPTPQENDHSVSQSPGGSLLKNSGIIRFHLVSSSWWDAGGGSSMSHKSSPALKKRRVACNQHQHSFSSL